MGLVTNGTHSSQMEIPNGNFPGFFVNGKRPEYLPSSHFLQDNAIGGFQCHAIPNRSK